MRTTNSKLAGWGLAVLLVFGASAEAGKKRDPLDLVNVALSPAYSQWMVGATGELASEAEVERFLKLTEDAAAERFVEEFWESRRGQSPDDGEPSIRAAMGLTDNPFKDLYDERALEADKLFSEAGYLGRRTARGTLFVMFGEPDENDYEVNPDPNGAAIVVWLFDRGRRGLDGRKSERRYRFIREGDLTIPYVPSLYRRSTRSRF